MQALWTQPRASMSGVNHWRRLVLWWLGTSIVATLLVVLFLAPILPPGNGSVEASGQVVDNTVLLGISTPVAMAVLGINLLGDALRDVLDPRDWSRL